MVDEELLTPSRAHLAYLNAQIAVAEREMVEKIERWGKDDKEFARQQSSEYYAKIEPIRREREAVIKVIADYYGLQPRPPQLIAAGQLPGGGVTKSGTDRAV